MTKLFLPEPLEDTRNHRGSHRTAYRCDVETSSIKVQHEALRQSEVDLHPDAESR
jgi:hypothetical protein